MSTTSTTILEGVSMTSPSRHAAEVAGATNRFAAAQKLFSHRAASSPLSSSPVHPSRPRTNTATSLYTKLDSSVTDSSSITSDSSASSFTDAFMKTRPRKIPQAVVATSLASSQAPPTPVDEGCVLPGPRRSLHPLDVTKSLNLRTTTGSPAWYCRHDKLVVFDGFLPASDGRMKMVTRSSRGLAMARRNCRTVAVKVVVPCGHCRNLLGVKGREWVFEERMLECSVCRGCQERCMREWEKMEQKAVKAEVLPAAASQPTSEAVAQDSGPEALDVVSDTVGAVPRVRSQDGAKDEEQQAKRDSVLQDDEPVGS